VIQKLPPNTASRKPIGIMHLGKNRGGASRSPEDDRIWRGESLRVSGLVSEDLNNERSQACRQLIGSHLVSVEGVV
jgi:hypothetical protein